MPETSAAPAATQMHLHRVLLGQSLWSIARRDGVRMTELQMWNRLGGQMLQPNQELIVFLPDDWTAAR